MKETTRKLLDKAKTSIKSAEKLGEPDEAGFAASRAYYAMFYVAEALLIEKGLSFKKHGGVHSAFGEHFIKTGKLSPEYHRWLIEAFNSRIKSDYDIELSLSTEAAREIIQQARKFLEAARQHLS